MEIKTRFKLWLETENGYVFGEGLLQLLSKVQERGTLRGAAEDLGMSYRHAWGKIKTAERRFGKPILKTHKGGTSGGGGAELTEEGIMLLNKYLEIKKTLTQVSDRIK